MPRALSFQASGHGVPIYWGDRPRDSYKINNPTFEMRTLLAWNGVCRRRWLHDTGSLFEMNGSDVISQNASVDQF